MIEDVNNQENSYLNVTQPKPKDFIVLGFDFGMKSIGVAVGQSITMNSKPLTSLKATDGVPDWQEIDKLIKNWRPSFLIVGLALNLDQSATEISLRANKFSKKLAAQYPIKVEVIDERLTTKEATTRFRDSNIKKFDKGQLDAVSASVILDAWFKSRC